jgi:peptidoglycan hydrolase CwlO-like protein
MEWPEIFQQLGFPVAATVCLGYVLMKVTIFFGEKIYIPLQDKHYALVAKLESSLDTVNNCQMDLVINMTKLAASLADMQSKLGDISDNQAKVVELIAKLSNSITELENRINKVESKN